MTLASTEGLQGLADALAAAFPSEGKGTIARGELTVTVKRESLVAVATFLRDDPNCLFKILLDVCGVDYLDRPERFEVVLYWSLPMFHLFFHPWASGPNPQAAFCSLAVDSLILAGAIFFGLGWRKGNGSNG